MVLHPFRELDTVEALTSFGDRSGEEFPAHTRAVIVDLGGDYALVEVVDDDGRVHGPFDVASTDVRLVAHTERRADETTVPKSRSVVHRAA
ncbi:MAG: hypothetical protein ACYCUM_11680 [Solirubrobacteraceae bacterium]